MNKKLYVFLLILIISNECYSQSTVIKVGQCPSGYYTSGNYCITNKSPPPTLIPKVGQCPPGYHTSGAYCIKS